MKLPKYPILATALAVAMAVQALAQTPPPNPQPDPGGPNNIFYGAIPPNANAAPVVVFIHGLGANASYWWVANNSPYQSAYKAGYRTAFISLSLNNSVNVDTVAQNAQTLQKMLPLILQRYNTNQAYFVCHSKGGLDFTQALVNSPSLRAMTKGVVTVASPNQGSVFAEWVYGGPAVPPGVVPFATWRQCSDGTTNCLSATIAALIDNKIKSPGLQSIATSQITTLRTSADTILKTLQIPFMTVTGNRHPPLDLQNPGASAVLAVSGYILDNVVTPGTSSDGLVSVPESKLPSAYAFDDATMSKNHVEVGQDSFGLIAGRLDGLEAMVTGFSKVATGGFGDSANTWAWSMKWFQNALYVGTGRELQCVTLATSAVAGMQTYPGKSGCTPDPANLRIQAEIWRYPVGGPWQRVYQSPAEIPVKTKDGATVMTAAELGIRNLYVFTENPGTPQAKQVLYAGGVSANCMFGQQTEYAGNMFPAPRILRSENGTNWAALPNPRGTFLGDLAQTAGLPSGEPDITVVSFRSFETFNGKLHAVVTNLRGEGFVVASDSTPWLGGNHWRRVSPSLTDNFTPHVWALKAYAGKLYAPGGNRSNQTAQTAGYTVYKTDGSTDSNGYYNWTPVILFGGFQTGASQVQSPVALTAEVSNNMLYVGTNRRTELIRIRPDDTWDLVVGFPRQVPKPGDPFSSYNNCPPPMCSIQCTNCPTASGATGDLKRPISGFMNYFNNTFNAHFWQMKDDAGSLYLGTYDESIQVEQSNTINPFFNAIMGTDLLKTPDGGATWTQIQYNGFYDGANFGSRSMESTPIGFFLGTARNAGGAQIWQNTTALDLNKDGVIDQKDVSLVMSAAASQTKASAGDSRDLDGDGKITVNDSRLLSMQCTFSGCTTPPANMLKAPALPAPTQLVASPGPVPVTPGTVVNLTWAPVSGATRYHVYRMTQKTLSDLLRDGPPASPNTLSTYILDYGSATVQDMILGKLNSYCTAPDDNSWCDLMPAIKAFGNPAADANTLVGFPSAPLEVAVVRGNSYSETAPTTLQSNYWVRAEDVNGVLSPPSNFVGAPSLWVGGGPTVR